MQLSEKGREAIQKINRLMQEVDSIFSSLSNEDKDACLDFHVENSSLNHCVRWGVQAAQDLAVAACVDVEPAAATTYQGAAAQDKFWHCVNSFMQPDATGCIQELVRDEKYDLMLRDIQDEQGGVSEGAIRSALESAEMIIIDSGNVHGDAWIATFHPRQMLLSVATEVSGMWQKDAEPPAAPRG